MAGNGGPLVWLKLLSAQLKEPDLADSRRTIFLASTLIAAAAGLSACAFALRNREPRKPKVLGVIPARWGSSRFRGKPLVQILGKPLIQRTWENARLARTLTRVVVATDDERIADCCRGFGGEVLMTSPEWENGSERCAEVMQQLREKFDIIVNIQGDEPLLEPEAIDAVVATLQRKPDAVAATAVADLAPAHAADPNRVKCVIDVNGYALYFSRSLIPSNQNGTPNRDFPYMLHLGLQAFRANFLEDYVKFQSTPLESEEQLEQLRILETGHKLAVVKVRHRGHGVDVPSDIKLVEEALKKHDFSAIAR